MSTNAAFYLKYRPQSLSELIGQESVKKNLLLSFQNNKLSHAYLFVGPRGTGKTSTARILAKMVNCESQKEAPCNKCATCFSITDGSNLDLIEIDAASNRGIEDIRSLRDKIKLAPSASKKKVYIIDEVHMLTTEAFNALLKTLEEPPEHVLFILATTEIAKIPQTILSRVQRLDFKLATPEELLEALQKIASQEKIDIDEESLKILVKKSDGSFRDGVKLLDQLSVGEKITATTINESLKSSHFESELELMDNFRNKDAKAGLLNISKQLENGVDAKTLMFGLMDIFRNLVLIKNGVGEQLVRKNFTEDKYHELESVANNFTHEELVKNLNILQENLEKLKFSSISSLPLELSVVEICTPLSVIASEAKQSSSSVKSQIEIATTGPSDFRNDNISHSGSHEVADGILKQQDPLPVRPAGGASLQDDHISKSETSTVLSGSPDILKLKEKWTFVLETIRPFNFSLEALLRNINITECTDTTVMLEVPYSFHQRILEAPKNRDLLESILSDILGRSIRLSTVLGSRPERREDIANIELAGDDEIIRAAAEIFNSDTIN